MIAARVLILSFQFDHQPLGTLDADARHLGERRNVLGRDRGAQVVRLSTDTTAWAILGPMPLADWTSSKQSRSSASAGHYRVRVFAHHQRGGQCGGRPEAHADAVAGVHWARSPKPFRSTTQVAPAAITSA